MAFISTSVFSQNPNQVKASTETTTETVSNVEWDSQDFDFGSLPQNIAAEAEFVFTNISKEPVIISKVKSSCGCTVTGYDKSPVMPGESSTITATYNARKMGDFRKSVRVYMSDFQPHTLTIKGNVEEDQTIGLK